jgi:hypothetical protein
MTKTDALFTELNKHITETVYRPRRWNTWITKETWTLIDKRAALRRCHERVQSAASQIYPAYYKVNQAGSAKTHYGIWYRNRNDANLA